MHNFFSSGFSHTNADDSQDSRGREGTMLYSPLALPPDHEHSVIYLQLCMWDDHHVFLVAPLVTTRLLLDEFYHLIELPFWLIDDAMLVSVCLLDDLILNFCYNSLSLETGGLELTSTITLVLQATRPTKCAWISLDQQSKVLCNLFLLYTKLRAIEKYWNLYLIQNFFKKQNKVWM